MSLKSYEKPEKLPVFARTSQSPVAASGDNAACCDDYSDKNGVAKLRRSRDIENENQEMA
jgi:hypothetical protein